MTKLFLEVWHLRFCRWQPLSHASAWACQPKARAASNSARAGKYTYPLRSADDVKKTAPLRPGRIWASGR